MCSYLLSVASSNSQQKKDIFTFLMNKILSAHENRYTVRPQLALPNYVCPYHGFVILREVG
jgi:hypothetical protein